MKGGTIRVSVVRSLLVLAALLILSGWATELLADETADQSLADLQGIAVMVAPMYPEAELNGIKREPIQTDIERKLRKSGIRILTEREIEKRGFPYLSVEVDVKKDKTPELYGYNVKVVLYKQVIINPEDADENMGFALYDAVDTWTSEQAGTAPSHDLKNNIQKQLDDDVDKFIKAYLAANPQKTDKP